MALPTAYRNQLLAQFVDSFVTFIHNKRTVAQLLAKGTLTAEEAIILQHCQQAVAHDRAVFQIWKNDVLIAKGGYTLAQIKTFILNNRAAVLDAWATVKAAEMAEIDALKVQTEASATTETDLANLPNLLAELDNRKGIRQYWRDLALELKAKTDADYATEAEL